MNQPNHPKNSRISLRLGALLGLLGLSMWGCSDSERECTCNHAQPTVPPAAASSVSAQPKAKRVVVHQPPAPVTRLPEPVLLPTAHAANKTKPPAASKTATKPVAKAKAKPAPKPLVKAPARKAPTTAAVGAAAVRTMEVTSDLGVIESATALRVEQRTPIGVSETFRTDVGKVWAYIRVKNQLEPTKVTMVWKKGGEEKFRIDLNVGTSHGWRTWSRKTITARDTGDWTVEVLSAEGDELHSFGFRIVPAESEISQVRPVVGC